VQDKKDFFRSQASKFERARKGVWGRDGGGRTSLPGLGGKVFSGITRETKVLTESESEQGGGEGAKEEKKPERYGTTLNFLGRHCKETRNGIPRAENQYENAGT